MIKLVFCLRRLPHLSRQEFQRYWLESHGPLVRQLAPALGVKRYVQVHTVTSAFSEAMSRHRGAPEDFDGVAELWWDSVDDFAAPAPPRRAATRDDGCSRTRSASSISRARRSGSARSTPSSILRGKFREPWYRLRSK